MVGLKYFADYNYYKILYGSSYVDFPIFEPYDKSHFLNRCIIPGANGPIGLSVPLHGGRNQKSILKEVRIENGENWQKRHYRSMLATYNASPWFKYYSDSLSVLFQKRFTFLIDWNLECFAWTVAKLKLQVRFEVVDTPAARNIQPPLKRPKTAQDLPGVPRYRQLFEEKTGFIPGVSILDMLFCEGQSQVLASLASDNR